MTPTSLAVYLDTNTGRYLVRDENETWWRVYHQHRDYLRRLWFWATDGAGRFIRFKPDESELG